MRFNELNEENFLFFAIQNYNNPQSVTQDDFFNDLKKIKYLKRLFKKYKTTGEIKTDLILIHITVLYNVFGAAATPMLFFKISSEYWSCLKSFLVFLNRLEETQLKSVPIDQYCLDKLGEI